MACKCSFSGESAADRSEFLQAVLCDLISGELGPDNRDSVGDWAPHSLVLLYV